MDPYKVLGISANQVKTERDVEKVRQRSKMLYQRFRKEGKKFDAKKILEAFELVKQRQKGRIGEGQYKILGRSRKERELDRHFNNQTKEIKGDKRLQKALRHAKHGTLKERFHLPGDKERIPRQRRSHRHRSSRRRRHHERAAKQQQKVNILEGLKRLAALLPQESKFPKCIKLLRTWMKEYMSADNREEVFQVLDGVVHCDFLTDDVESRQDIIQVFEYVLAYFKDWFDKDPNTAMLAQMWHVATVLACQCYTDDAFVLSSVIIKLTKAFELLEKHRDEIGIVPEPIKRERVKKEEGEEPPLKRAKQEDEDDEKFAKEEQADSSDDEGGVKEELKEEPPEVKTEASPSTMAEIKTELDKVKIEEKAKRGPLMAQRLPGMGATILAAPVGPHLGQRPSPSVEASPEAEPDPVLEAEVLSSGDEDGGVCAIDSEDEVLDVVSEGSSDVEKIELDDDEEDEDGVAPLEMSDDEDSDIVEELEGSVWPTPHPGKSLDLLREHFVDRCLATLFHQRGPPWARPKIDAFFQEVFYRREVLSEPQQMQVEAWQSRIKSNQKIGEREVGEANNPLEAHRPVVDSRETRTSFGADSNSWAAKQTFDSRESASHKVIR